MSFTCKEPKLRFGEFSGEWEKQRLEKIGISIIDGDRGTNYPNGNDFSDDGYCLFLNAKNVTKNGFSFVEKSFISQKKDNDLKKGKLERFDIVLTTRGTVGNISYYNETVPFEHLRINSGMVLVRTNCKTINSSYLFRYFNSNQIQNEIIKISFGSAQPQLTVGEISKLKVCFPSKPEQEKIASFLTVVDAKIEQLTCKDKLLQKYKKSAMQKLFSQELRFTCNDESRQAKDNCLSLVGSEPKAMCESTADGKSEYPEWEEKKINQIFEITRGNVLAVPNMSQEKTIEFQYPVFSSQTKNNGLTGYYNEYLFENCITWTTDGANAGDVNFRKGKFYCTNVCGVLKSDKGYANQFIAEILNSVTKKHVSYVGNPKLMNNVMGQIKIKIPFSIEEQTKIANFLSAIDEKCLHVKAQLEQTRQFKKALLQQMFV